MNTTTLELKEHFNSEMDEMAEYARNKIKIMKLEYAEKLTHPYSERQKINKIINIAHDFIEKVNLYKTKRLYPIDENDQKQIERIGIKMFIRINMDNLIT